MKRYASVEDYIAGSGDWQEALRLLRETLLRTELVETVKWGMPVYTIDNKNVVGLGAFKSFVGIWFFQGALLKDTENKLVNAQEGKTQAMRQWRFQGIDEVVAATPLIDRYLQEAISNQKSGKTIKPRKNQPIQIPQELSEAFDHHPGLQDAFSALSLSKRRDYAEHIAEAKRAETRQRRLEKIIPLVLAGKGLNDAYK